MYGSEFLAVKTATEQIMDNRQTMRYLGVHSNSCHNILAFHRVTEAIAAKIMALYWIQSAYNLSDMLSNHWDL